MRWRIGPHIAFCHSRETVIPCMHIYVLLLYIPNIDIYIYIRIHLLLAPLWPHHRLYYVYTMKYYAMYRFLSHMNVQIGSDCNG